MRAVVVATALLFSVFAVQLVRIQGLEAKSLADQARRQRLIEVREPATRGRLLTSEGVVLAATLRRYAVVADPQNVCLYLDPVYKRTGKDTCRPAYRPTAVAAAVKALAPLLGKAPAELTAALNRTGRFAVLSRSVSPESWRKVQALKIPGVYQDPGEARPERVYPQGGATGSLVGYLQADGTGTGGLERLAAPYLKGTPGTATYETAADGSVLPLGDQRVEPAVDGSDVTTTVNADLQWYAQRAISEQVAKTGALSGTVIVMDVQSGRLYAVASAPTFDPNHLTSSAGTFSNTAFSEIFEPGSTAKVMTVAAALQEKTVTPRTPIVIPGQIHRYDTYFKDSHAHGTELRTVAGALAESSNLGMILISETMKASTIERHFRDFGIGSVSGSGFPGELRGLFAPSSQWSGTQRYTVVYGQGVSVTAIQAASVFQTIANGGVRVQPRLLDSVTGPDGVTVPLPPSPSKRVVSAQVAKDVTQMLEGAASKEGTAPAAQIAGYRVAGKTGTANRPTSHGYSGYTASFIGFAPADKPRLVVAVILQRPQRGHFGGVVAAPVFHDVMQFALQELSIPPTGTRPGRIQLKLDRLPGSSSGLVLRDGVRPTAR